MLLKRLYYYSNHAHSVHRVGVDPFQVTFCSNVALQSVHYTWSGFMEHNTRKYPTATSHWQDDSSIDPESTFFPARV